LQAAKGYALTAIVASHWEGSTTVEGRASQGRRALASPALCDNGKEEVTRISISLSLSLSLSLLNKFSFKFNLINLFYFFKLIIYPRQQNDIIFALV